MKIFHIYNWHPKSILTIAIFSLTWLSAYPAGAFIPYIYEPNEKNLQETALSIGKTAAQLIEIRESKEAAQLLLLAIKLKPNDYRLWAVLAEAELRANRLEKAEYALKQAKRINPNNASLWFAEGSLLLRQQKTNRAFESINKGLKLEPKNATAYFQLGNAKIIQKKPRKAINSFQTASKLKPNFWEAMNNEGLVLFELGKTRKAIILWKKVLKIELNAEPMLALAAALNKLEPKNTEAVELAQEALLKNPNYIFAKYQKEQLWGDSLQKATQELLSRPVLRSAVEQATANAN